MPTPCLEFGTSQVDITPKVPIPLAGFAHRNNQPFSGVASALYLKAFMFRVRDRTKCLLIADVLWWPPELIEIIRQEVFETWDIEASDLLLHATHNHCAPQTSSHFTPGLGMLHRPWQEELLTHIHDAIGEASAAIQPAHILRFGGQSGISRNRRVAKGLDQPTDEWTEGLLDRELTTLLIQGTNNEPLGAIIHFACHPTILRGTVVSAEFPGVTCDLVSKHLGSVCPVGFLQGCSGDTGPMEEGETFYDAERTGHQLAVDVLRSLDTAGEPITPDPDSGRFIKVELPFETLPSTSELETLAPNDDYIGEWARLLLDRQPVPASVDLEVQHFSLGSSLSIVAFNAEVVSRYGLLVKSITRGIALPCGYSNGMIGYVVTDEQRQNGGYEVDESTKYFALPARFAHGNEKVINNALGELLLPSL